MYVCIIYIHISCTYIHEWQNSCRRIRCRQFRASRGSRLRAGPVGDGRWWLFKYCTMSWTCVLRTQKQNIICDSITAYIHFEIESTELGNLIELILFYIHIHIYIYIHIIYIYMYVYIYVYVCATRFLPMFVWVAL